MENFVTAQLRVSPRIRLLNKYIQKAKKVAINSIQPTIYVDANGQQVSALNISVEGPAQHLSYLKRLIDDANLKVG